MALQRAISACEEDHESYIMELPDADIKQLISKRDEDGRYDIILMSSSVLRHYQCHAELSHCAGQITSACCCL